MKDRYVPSEVTPEAPPDLKASKDFGDHVKPIPMKTLTKDFIFRTHNLYEGIIKLQNGIEMYNEQIRERLDRIKKYNESLKELGCETLGE
jgi:hypothetical protein